MVSVLNLKGTREKTLILKVSNLKSHYSGKGKLGMKSMPDSFYSKSKESQKHLRKLLIFVLLLTMMAFIFCLNSISRQNQPLPLLDDEAIKGWVEERGREWYAFGEAVVIKDNKWPVFICNGASRSRSNAFMIRLYREISLVARIYYHFIHSCLEFLSIYDIGLWLRGQKRHNKSSI